MSVYENLGFESFEEITSGLYPFENDLVCSWDKIPVAAFVNIYYKKVDRNDGGFIAYVYDSCDEETLFTVQAHFFDGIRHLYMGDPRDASYDEYEKRIDGSYGYIYYAKPKLIAKIFEMLAELVEKFCQKGSYEL